MTKHPLRIHHQNYSVLAQPCFITIGTLDRNRVFAQHSFATAATVLVIDYAKTRAVPLHVFCLMPDHAHVLLEATQERSIIMAVQEIKGLLTRLAWQHGFKGKIFQRRFFDHFLRKDEDVITVVHYILNNPVRAGLVKHWWEYPYMGSTVYNLEDLKNA